MEPVFLIHPNIFLNILDHVNLNLPNEFKQFIKFTKTCKSLQYKQIRKVKCQGFYIHERPSRYSTHFACNRVGEFNISRFSKLKTVKCNECKILNLLPKGFCYREICNLCNTNTLCRKYRNDFYCRKCSVCVDCNANYKNNLAIRYSFSNMLYVKNLYCVDCRYLNERLRPYIR